MAFLMNMYVTPVTGEERKRGCFTVCCTIFPRGHCIILNGYN